MVDVTVLPGFVAVILLFLVPPGPDMAFMVATGLEGGRKAAVRAILGIGTGMSVYAAAVVVGVGRLAQSQPVLLHGIQLFGAVYLVWLAVGALRGAGKVPADGTEAAPQRPYLRGVVVTLANPKVLLFFLAVLPQFTGDAANPTLQLAMLGAVNVLSEVLLYGAIGLMAGTFHARFTGSPRAGAVLSRVAAAVYLGLAGVVVVELVRSATSA